jgi:hypothetical protein
MTGKWTVLNFVKVVRGFSQRCIWSILKRGVGIFLILVVTTVWGQAIEKHVEIDNTSGETLYHAAIEIDVLSQQLGIEPECPNFVDVRFYTNEPERKLLCSWKYDQEDCTRATYYVRIPVLVPGLNSLILVYDESLPPQEVKSLVPRLLALDGLRLNLQTDPPNKETVHPSVVVAEGWMTRLRPDSEPNVSRVLVDTMWPSDPSPYTVPEGLENPELWLSGDDGITWSWPPDVNINPAWPYHNNWLVGPEFPGGYGADPEAIFLKAGSLPNGQPLVDTLRVYYHATRQCGGCKIAFIDVTSSNGAWSGVSICGFNPTNLESSWNVSALLSPAIVQESDGSLNMWVGEKWNNTIYMRLYNSVDGVNFNLVGPLVLNLPKNLVLTNGGLSPWHYDVIKAGQAYWMAASFGSSEFRMMRSEDGLNFELLLPTVLEKGYSNHWFYPGTYRPTMLYIPDEGLEFYIGSSARTTSTPPVRGGTGRWTDPNWSPDVGRAVEDIAMVFWGSAREFTEDPCQWPHPWYRVDDAWNSTQKLDRSDSIITISTDPNSPKNGALIDSIFTRPKNHEFHIRLRIENDCYAVLQGNGWYGPWIDSRNPPYGQPSGVTYRWNQGATVCGPIPIGNVNNFHIFKSRRLVDQSWMWWDGNEGLPSPFGTSYGNGYGDDLLWRIVRSQQTIQKSLSVNWYFYRDAIEPEPIIGFLISISGNIGIDDVTLNGLPGNPVTSGGGFYSAIVPEGWSGIVIPSKAGYIFSPESISYTNVIADANNQDYDYTGHDIHDFNGDGFVDYSDLMEFCDHWLETGAFIPYDFSEDGTVNFVDFADFASAW